MDVPAPGTVLGLIDDLPDPGGKVSDWAGETPLFLVRSGDRVGCFVNVCPHAGRPLSLPDGRIFLHKGADIICPVHGATFDSLSGECTGGPAGSPLTSIPVQLVGNRIQAV